MACTAQIAFKELPSNNETKSEAKTFFEYSVIQIIKFRGITIL